MNLFLEKILDIVPNVTSVINTINTEKNNTAKGNPKTIFGSSYINEKIGNYIFKISANSFFQTNSYQVKILYDYIIKTSDFKKNDVVYDLYCGTGTIGIYISQFVKKVYGIEIIEDAIKDAKINAEINNINNIKFYCGDLKDILDSQILENIEKPTTVIVDPPRPGLHPNTVRNLIRLSPKKIIYVSCNPATMARDIELLIRDNYSIKDLQPVDMFPHTPHIECVTTLVLN
jgi:23S rRNA (uracil1939-C5)-methyltransferase